MLINAQERFSQDQPLRAVGDTRSSWSVDTGPGHSLPGIDRPFIRVHVAAALMSEGASTLQLGIQGRSDDGEEGDVFAITDELEVSPRMPRILLVMRLPQTLPRHVWLVYRVKGAPLARGALTAFLTPEGEQQPRGAAEAPAARNVYYPSGWSMVPGFNRPGQRR